jgi:hypothetical protein
VEYRPGKLNGAVDALPRRDEEVTTIHSLSAPTFQLFDALRAEADTDPQVADLRAKLVVGVAREGWTQVDGLLLFKGLFILDASAIWPLILAETHDCGHEGVEKTLHRWRASFYSPHAARNVREFVRGCTICQQKTTEHLHPAGLLQPLPVPSEVWSDIVMDFVEGFLKVGGKSVVLTVVDRFSKYVHFIPLGHPYTTTSVAKAFFKGIVRLHELPCSIVSDRDTVFTCTFWSELFHLAKVKMLMNSAFHPQTDGQFEVVNRVIVMYLRCLAEDRPKTCLQCCHRLNIAIICPTKLLLSVLLLKWFMAKIPPLFCHTGREQHMW